MIKFCSGDQDSVVPLLGSQTLVRELAHDLQLKVTVPYGAWFHKGQVIQLYVFPISYKTDKYMPTYNININGVFHMDCKTCLDKGIINININGIRYYS